MLIIGERINSSRKGIAEVIDKKDSEFIKQEALAQVKAGASWLDINCGMSVKDETQNMEWLVKTVQGAVDVPLVIDSPNPETIECALRLCRKKAMVNSITGENERIKIVLPLIKKYEASVIALTMDEKGMPHTAQERVNIARKIINALKEYNIPTEKIYFDTLIRPISTEPDQTVECLEAIKLIKKDTKAKTIAGVSNISFGLPNRKLLNSTFITMALWAGIDSAIIDPTDKLMMSAIKAAEALLNKDEYCLNYITAHRENRL